MRKVIAIVALLGGILVAQTAPKKTAAGAASKAAKPAATVMTPDKINWGDAPPVFQPGAKLAVLSGNPAAAGQFIVRLKFPDGYKVMPHWHPTAENVTVVSGEFHVGMGDKWNDAGMLALPASSFASVPAHHSHYAVAKGETIVQVSAMGPFKLVYVNPADDPSKKK
ncbi:MAG TPA: cupin domain-containing protein [Candidatus Angelobacter sp.]